MGLEVTTNIAGLVATNPLGGDSPSTIDNHLRLIKDVLQKSFVGFTGAVMGYGGTAGTSTAYTVAPTVALPAYVAGGIYIIVPHTTSGATPTLNWSGLGAKNIKDKGNGSLVAGALTSGQPYLLEYDGTSFRAVNMVGDHSARALTGNGYGSGNTKVRNFTTITTTGSLIVGANSGTNGASFTVSESGIYIAQYTDVHSAAAAFTMGISVDSAELTTDIQSLTTNTARVAMTAGPATSGAAAQCFAVLRLAASSVVRAHNGTTLPTGTSDRSDFWIRKIA